MIIGFEDYKHKYDFTDVTGVIHVGAHHGQEIDAYMETFGNIITHWFEPLPDAFQILHRNVLGKYPNTNIYQFALGDKFESISMYVDSGNDGQSSSLLKPIEHTNLFPHITFENKAMVHVRPLDSFHINNSNLLVLDVQGYELKCLYGSIETLKSIKYVFSEYNTNEMYEGCPTLDELNMFLSQHGFSMRENYITSDSWGDAFWSK